MNLSLAPLLIALPLTSVGGDATHPGTANGVSAELEIQEPAAAKVQKAEEADVMLGTKDHRYRWVPGWLKLPEGMKLGNTHGCVAVDSKGRVYFNTDSEHAVVVVNPDGTVANSWGAEWKGGLHGMCLTKEADGKEYLYLAHIGRHMAAKTTLDGEVLWTLPWPKASGKYESEGQYKPTGIAVAPDGRIFVADGYGQSWVHRYSKDREYLGSFGGLGAEPGQMRTPHGVVIETIGDTSYVVVCDRANRRVQRFDLDGNLVRSEAPKLQRPCSGVFTAGILAVAELGGGVALLGLDENGERQFIDRLGENPEPSRRGQNGVPVEQWAAGQFLSPHGVGADAEGNLFVLDWNRNGRVSKLERVSPLPKASSVGAPAGGK